MNDPLNFDHTVLGQLIAQRWQQDPPYYTLNRNVRGGWLEPSWMQRAGHSALELHWTRRTASQSAAERPATE